MVPWTHLRMDHGRSSSLYVGIEYENVLEKLEVILRPGTCECATWMMAEEVTARTLGDLVSRIDWLAPGPLRTWPSAAFAAT